MTQKGGRISSAFAEYAEEAAEYEAKLLTLMSCATWCESTGFSSHASTAGGGCPCNMLEPTKAESWEQALLRREAVRCA